MTIYLYDILCDKMGNMLKAFLLHTEILLCLKEKGTCVIELLAELATFCMEHHFYFERMTDKPYYGTGKFFRHFLKNE